MRATLVVLVALVWTALQGPITLRSVLGGASLAAAMAALGHLPGPGSLSLRRVGVAARLAWRFLVEMNRSALIVASAIWHPRGRISPGIVELPPRFKSDGAVTLLANLITMPPGTMTVEVTPQQDRLFVFALDARQPERVREEIRGAFARTIEELTR
ncbi:MAG: Na+/H+ antiporter subunit E [Firmicutes bacterium]|nr:Na+/H+ antiporter subunit E [Bacillota bacterium]